MQVIYRLLSSTAIMKRVNFLSFSMFTFLKVTQRRHRNSSGASILWKDMAEFAFYIDWQDFSGNAEPIRCKVGTNSELSC